MAQAQHTYPVYIVNFRGGAPGDELQISIKQGGLRVYPLDFLHFPFDQEQVIVLQGVYYVWPIIGVYVIIGMLSLTPSRKKEYCLKAHFVYLQTRM